MSLTVKLLLVIYCWPVWTIVRANVACEDERGPLQCGKSNCEAPGIANYCKKTCKVCTKEGCGPGHYQLSDGSCSSCSNPPKVSTGSYNRSCDIPCSGGLWGPNCDFHCEGCVDSICNRWTGNCDRGCKGCYWGNKCDETLDHCECLVDVCKCKKPYYGNKCMAVCSDTCKLQTCNVTGDCAYGCTDGWYGKKCDSQCRNCRYGQCAKETGICEYGCKTGYYGFKCDKNCSKNCLNGVCDGKTGLCTNGCDEGWHGQKCYNRCPIKCKDGTCDKKDGRCNGCTPNVFGNRCNKPCSTNCMNRTCHQNGYCVKGCYLGYYGEQCKNPCSSNCKNNRCNKKDGRCEDGCNSERYGDKCNKHCPKSCSSNSCNRTDGTCLSCIGGYKGSHCNTTCPDQCIVCDQYGYSCSSCSSGWYGKTCDNNCSTCFGDNCTNGFCVYGCKVDWYGDTCRKQCNPGCKDGLCNRTSGRCTEGCKVTTFGEFCNNTCSDHCHKRLCATKLNDYSNPSCTKACENGWWGEYCQNRCTSDCEICDKSNGTCILNECEGTRFGIQTCSVKKDRDRNVLILWVVVPSLLIILLVAVAFILLKQKKSPKVYLVRKKIYRSLGSNVNIFSMINPSYTATSKAASGPNSLDITESKPLTQGDDDTVVQLRADVSEKDPFYKPARMHPHIFSTYIPSLEIEEEVSRSDRAPSPCHVPEEPQLGCVWSTEVKVENFRDYVQTVKTNLGLTNQFFDLPYGQLGPCDEGEKQTNAFKNRYRNILPYDHSRVKLQCIQNIPCSDYINANYINAYGKPQAFVATQGPFADVLWDFWRMIWEIDSGKIVMLTNFVENRKNKCKQYWPDLGQPGINYDGVFVQCVTEKQLEDYTIRTFTAVNMEEEKGETRTIKQYHFTTWPDRDVPRDVTSVVDFHQVVKQSPNTRYGPIVVHCSAGVGRTGTFLALDYLIAQARAEGVVDVYACVTRLRHQRMDLIQTEEQYIFLHDALVEALPSADRPSREGVEIMPKTEQQMEPESTRNSFVEEKPKVETSRYLGRQLPGIPLDTFSTLLSETQDRRS